ncbi:hypothetical protein A2533_01510 [Candidatus Falkowbacteria bacterium RIFOXYD2_FULL_35_9]|uniref:Amino acid transporter transmembrane domain-containing protein n=1 Tax=Candidatus Falkowbacteria bacterium RIFOXYC2_FULL_36_12 TaxID=1798002 RepID=A0A1F5SWE6_9BACT|nr:MAG: hypothetical protein A2300_03730 [Candidatus Falkowbacteria bacterium RIFOXYB2_FULL_35_7]OGF30949.1 MAG: hypothetical protein A2478_00680 [Candidatus Falkowbacteria bacterium RIFOXYC2_FULL_36_12]OGF33019.1 MAG: hypothetical protein A2223_02175 [Candidatus Falkowbacteria bacterium RIFOXYA2_FULL_35_8]OGF45892.1 MAG: hypothetical protein A2533_01510 [Candidatus Falkowbacteria bacterium RIFOXYD2_FULL_35_9]
MLSKYKNLWQAVATLVGTIIGAGILGIPYVVARLGFWPGLIVIVVLGISSLLINLMIAEIMLRTRFRHQIGGLVKKYIGVNWEHIASFGMIIGAYGGLTAYLIGEGQVLAALFGQAENSIVFSWIFFIFSALILFIGLKLIKALEFWMVLLVVIVVVFIGAFSLPQLQIANFQTVDLSQAIVAYGVLLFAFGGTGAIFSVKEILAGDKKMIKPAIIIGSVLPIIVYILFALFVVGVTGMSTTEVATVGLGNALGNKVVIMGNLFAVLVMGSSFLTVGIGLKQLYQYDYKLPAWLAWILVIVVPLLIFLFISHNFIEVISLAGSLTFGVVGVLVVFAFWGAKNKGDQKPAFNLPKFYLVGSGLVLLFLIGVIVTLIDL